MKKTKQLTFNPHINSEHLHFCLAYESIFRKNGNIKILDFGCGNGRFIGKISDNNKILHGYEVDRKRVKEAVKKYPHVKFVEGKIGKDLPYSKNYFDVVCVLHVLEHASSEDDSINEISRILKKKGLLILASPYKGLFSWADAANIRYKFPRFHKFIVITLKGKKYFKSRYGGLKSKKMFYDTSLNRNWHKHYKEEEIRNLIESKFKIIMFKKYTFFLPFLLSLQNVYKFIFKKNCCLLEKLVRFDNQLNLGNLSYNFFLTAEKK